MQRGKDLVRNLCLHRDKIERGHANGSAGTDALGCDVKKLPVEVEALFGAQKAAGKHKRDKQMLANRERVHLRHGHLHQRARWTNNQRGNTGQARGDGVGQGKAVEWGDFFSAEVGEGKHHKRVLLRPVCR